MTNLYKKLAVAFAPENIKAQLTKLEELKRMEREVTTEAREVTRRILEMSPANGKVGNRQFETVMG
jgi:hypothetical protein